MPELLSLFPHGASRRCPPTVTFAPGHGCLGLDDHHDGDSSVYLALPLPEASAYFYCSIWLGLMGWNLCMVRVQGVPAPSGWNGGLFGRFGNDKRFSVCGVGGAGDLEGDIEVFFIDGGDDLAGCRGLDCLAGVID